MEKKETSHRGFTLVEILIVVGIIGMLATIAIPSFIHARQNSQTKSCINNLRQIYYAKERVAMENQLVPGDAVAESDVAEFLSHGMPQCPAGGSYSINPVDTDPTCTAADHICP